MRRTSYALCFVLALVFAVTSCCKADVADKDEEKKGTKEKKEQAAKKAPAASDKGEKQPENLGDMAPFQQAEALLSSVDQNIQKVKLALKPEQLAKVKAAEVHAFGTTEGSVRLLLYVFEYPDEEAAQAGLELIPDLLATDNLVHHAKLIQNGKLVLAAGTENATDDSVKVEERLADFVSGFML